VLLAAAGGPPAADMPRAARPRLGGISFLHRFGSALNHHLHLHACVTDGVFVPAAAAPACDASPVFIQARPITAACRSPRGLGRAASNSRHLSTWNRLADLVPPPRKHRHPYHGVLAPNHKLRPAVTALAIGNIGKRREAATAGRHGSPPQVSPARGPPTDWADLVQVHDDRDVSQATDRRVARDRHPQPLSPAGREVTTKPPGGRTRRDSTPTPDKRHFRGKASGPRTACRGPGDGSTRFTSRSSAGQCWRNCHSPGYPSRRGSRWAWRPRGDRVAIAIQETMTAGLDRADDARESLASRISARARCGRGRRRRSGVSSRR
jgi:hypothetical protein